MSTEVHPPTRSREETVIPLAMFTGMRPADVRGYVVLTDDGSDTVNVATDMCAECLIPFLIRTVELLTGQEWHS